MQSLWIEFYELCDHYPIKIQIIPFIPENSLSSHWDPPWNHVLKYLSLKNSFAYTSTSYKYNPL